MNKFMHYIVGVLIGVAVGLAVMEIHLREETEELVVSLNIARQRIAEIEAEEEQFCYEPYGTAVQPEFLAKQTYIKVTWLDDVRGAAATAIWMYSPENETSYCEIEVRMPDQILGDPDMDSLGHELLHCLVGDFHPEDN